MIKTLIRNCMIEELQTAPRIERVYRLLISDFQIQQEPDEINLYPKHWINFRNGMLDVKTGKCTNTNRNIKQSARYHITMFQG